MREAGEIASGDAIADARFRRATTLIGQEVRHPEPGGAHRIGTIRDIEFDPDSGRVQRVIVGDARASSASGRACWRTGASRRSTPARAATPARRRWAAAGTCAASLPTSAGSCRTSAGLKS